MEGSPQPCVSQMWRNAKRLSGVRWWGERPTWIRHVVYWAIALSTIAITAIDRSTRPPTGRSGDVASFAPLVIVGGVLAITGLLFTLREWEHISAVRNISRSLVLFTFLLGYMTIVLSYPRYWGVHIEACRTVGELETCQGPASVRQVLSMLGSLMDLS